MQSTLTDLVLLECIVILLFMGSTTESMLEARSGVLSSTLQDTSPSRGIRMTASSCDSITTSESELISITLAVKFSDVKCGLIFTMPFSNSISF